MATDEETTQYAALVQQAEEAVAGVKDPELRRVAFEKILATLLETDAKAGHKRTKGVKGANTPKAKNARTVKTAPSRPKALIEELIQEGFFKEQRTISDVKAELANRGYHVRLTSLSGPLQALTRDRRLRRQKVKANAEGSKSIYCYSNWV
jgi:hypothetical protein